MKSRGKIMKTTSPNSHTHKSNIHSSKFKHSILKISILLMLCLSLSIPASAATFSGGSGTIEDPFQLSSDSDIDTLSASSGYWGNQYNFILTQDITLVGNHIPIGNSGTKFTGNFNGSGFAVKNLAVYQTTDYAGFFGYTGSGANIHDLGVEISSEGVTGRASVGGLIGRNDGGTVNNSYAIGNVIGSSNDVGGLVGYNNGNVINSYATGSVSGSSGSNSVGGLVGYNNLGTVSNSYATGTVTGNVYVGGLVGLNRGTVSNSYATGNVTDSNNDVGGLVGYNYGTVSNSFATGSVTSSSSVGGLVGVNNGGTVTNSYYSSTGSYTNSLGTLTSYANFTSFTFVSGSSGIYWNESGNNITTLVDASFVWRMTDGYTLPYFQYQDMPAPLAPYVESISSSSGINNNAGSASFLLNVTGCSFNITDTVFVNLTMAGQTPINGTINSRTYTTINTTFDLTQAIAGDWSLYVINPDGQTSIAKNFTISAAPYSGGSGTEADPYLLSTDSDIDDLSATSADWGSYFELTNDITLTGNHTPIGNGSTQFTGNFNGSGFAIQNLTVYQTGNYAGFFGYAGSGANIHDLGIEISSDGVTGWASVGGLVGYNSGNVNNSYAIGNVTGSSNDVGGLVGVNVGTVTNSYATGNVTGTYYVGGLIGHNLGGTATVINSYATGDVTGSDNFVGGLVGYNNHGNATVSNCYATGDVTGNIGVGGLVGSNIGTVNNSFATGSATGSSMEGGLVGHNVGTVNNSYYSGSPVAGAGTSTSFASFTSFAFVSASPGLNWNESGNNITTVVDASFVWRMTDGYTLPYFQYQDMPAPLAPYVESISSSSGINNNAGSASFLLNVTGCSFNITDTVFVNLTMAGQTPINGTINSRTYTTINTTFDLTQAIAGDWSLYVINPDGQTSIAKNFTVQSLFTAGTPESFTNTTGNFWVNHSWSAGTGDVSDSYNVSYDGTWLNDTINSFNHTGLSAHAWSNITVYAYNATDSTISLGAIDNVQIPNNAVSILNVTDITVYEGENVTFNINSTDADGDTPIFGCNSTLFDTFNTSTGEGSWITGLSDAGTYYVEFNVSDGYGSVDSQVMTITIIDTIIPVANFSANITMGPYPLSVQFTDNSSNIPTDWFWDFGDGTNSTLQNPAIHTYNVAGIYNVSLNASNLAGSDLSSNMTITVTRPGTPESFTNTTGNFWVNHSWSAGSGDVSDSYNVSYDGTWLNDTINSFNHTGLSAHAWSNITVYAYNTTDSTISLGAIDNVQIPNNAVSILNVTDITVYEGENVTFNINSTDADGDTPIFGCNNSALFDSFNTSTGEGSWITDLSDAGIYYVEFNVSDGYGSVDSQVMTITINDVIIPVADINANITMGPYPLSVQFTDNSSNIPTGWFWDFGDGTNSTLQNPATHTYSDAGIYNVSLNASNLAGSNISSNMTITVTRPGTPESFTNTTGNFWVNHSWSAGTGDVSDSYNVSYDGTWLNDTINSFNHTGLSAHAWSNITVYAYNATDSTISLGAIDNVQIPNNAVSILNVTDITVYEGENVTFNINSTDADGDTPIFGCNNSALFDTFNTSTGEGLWITDLSDAGTYYVEFNVSDGYGSIDSQVMTITINDVIIPVANFSANTVTGYAPLSVQFTDNSSNNPTAWFWNFGDDTNSSQQNITHTYSAIGTYYVSLNASNLAGSNLSSNMTITVTTEPSSGSSRSGGSSGSIVIRETDEPEESTGEANTEEKSTRYIESVSFETDTGGKIQGDVIVWSSEETAYISVSTGTKVTDASGESVSSIRIVDIPVSDVPAAMDVPEMDDAMALHAYECTPNGTTFSPAIHLTFTLSEEEWEQYGESAKVGWYNDDTGEWEIIQGTADASTRTITIQVSHFSTYALFGDDAGEPVAETQDKSARSSTPSWLWVLLLLVIVGGAGYYIAQVKKKE
jgi:PKD repeat protein